MPALTTVGKPLPMQIERGEGARLFDAEGNAFWDFYGGHAVALLGQAHPRWVRAISEQAARLSFVTTLAPTSVRDRANASLCAFARMDRSFLVNSGAEANEAALKVARKATGRSRIVAMQGGFHGRTMACLGVTESGHYRTDHAPIHGEATFVPFGDVEALRAAVDDRVAAVLIEPIQGIAGAIEAPAGFLSAARAICDGVGAALILDEVQTGIGRTGEALAWHAEPGCDPDLVTVGKSLGAGFPVAALLLTEAMAQTCEPGEHGSTFGGAPLACAALLAVLDAIEQEDLLARAQALEAQVRALAPPSVTVRGRGCLLGLVLDRPAAPIATALRADGFLVGTSNDARCLRLCPPAVMPPDAVEGLITALCAALSE